MATARRVLLHQGRGDDLLRLGDSLVHRRGEDRAVRLPGAHVGGGLPTELRGEVRGEPRRALDAVDGLVGGDVRGRGDLAEVAPLDDVDLAGAPVDGPATNPGVSFGRPTRNMCGNTDFSTWISSSAVSFACVLYMPIMPSNWPRSRSSVIRPGTTAMHMPVRFGARSSSMSIALPPLGVVVENGPGGDFGFPVTTTTSTASSMYSIRSKASDGFGVSPCDSAAICSGYMTRSQPRVRW
jgi:hypothetical protein